jgi:hypothetical protein
MTEKFTMKVESPFDDESIITAVTHALFESIFPDSDDGIVLFPRQVTQWFASMGLNSEYVMLPPYL